jgi:bifunctional enzyme CysN/CysC
MEVGEWIASKRSADRVSPLSVCVRRDPKGIYRININANAPDGRVPGIQEPYERPEHPDVVVRGDEDDPAQAAQRIVQLRAAPPR